MPNFKVGDKVKLKSSVRFIINSHNGEAYTKYYDPEKKMVNLLNKTAIVTDTEMYYNGVYFNEIYYVDEKAGYYVDADSLIKVKDEELKQDKNIDKNYNMSIEIYNDKISIQVKDSNHYEVNRFKDETDNELLERAFQLAKTEYDKQTKINNTFPKYGDTYYKFVSFSPEEEAAEKNIVKMIFNPMCIECLIDKRLNNIAATKEELNLRKEEIYNNFYTFLKGDNKNEKDSNNYGYYVTPFKYCVDLARNDMLDINSCDGPYDTLEEATEQGIDYDTISTDSVETWYIFKVNYETNKVISIRSCKIFVNSYVSEEEQI